MILVASCNHSKKMHVTKKIPLTNVSDAGKNDLTEASPSTCIVIATILAIYPPDTTQADSWCGKFSCTALLHIDEIKSCGSGVTGMIDLSTNTEASFTFTLAPTDSVDKTIPMQLPGLSEGDKILTALHIHPGMDDRLVYSIYSYKIIPK